VVWQGRAVIHSPYADFSSANRLIQFSIDQATTQSCLTPNLFVNQSRNRPELSLFKQSTEARNSI
jgi:hypothetical protein